MSIRCPAPEKRGKIRTGITDALLTSDSFMGFGQRVLGYTECGIPQDEILLPELLRSGGYRTALVGKWHLGDKSPHLPNDTGFDEFYGPLRSNDLRPFEIFRNRELVESHPADQATLTRRYTQEAVRFIEENRSRPFFLYLAHTFPHIPLHASDAFRGKSAAGRYGDTVEEIDWSTGNVLAALSKHGLAENTLVIFTSDNGPWYLFNLATDPEESYSLLENRPEMGRELAGAMACFEAQVEGNPRGWLCQRLKPQS